MKEKVTIADRRWLANIPDDRWIHRYDIRAAYRKDRAEMFHKKGYIEIWFYDEHLPQSDTFDGDAGINTRRYVKEHVDYGEAMYFKKVKEYIPTPKDDFNEIKEKFDKLYARMNDMKAELETTKDL